MKRLPILLLLALAVGFIVSCAKDEGPTGPVMTAPDSLTAMAISANQVYLEWTDTTPFEIGFRIQRALSGSESWSLVVDSLEIDEDNYTDSGLEEGTIYRYRVKAFNARGETGPSDIAVVTTFANRPSGLVAEQDTSAFTTIKLTWIDESEKETGFQIQRKLGRNGEYAIINEVVADTTSYLDVGLDENVLYYYQVRAMIDEIGSVWSVEDGARTNILTPLPPSNLVAEAASPSTIRLWWDDNADDNDGFILERSLWDDRGWAAIIELEDIESHLDGNLYDETTYYYRLTAFNSHGNSDYSNIASATTTKGPPLPPSNLRLESATDSSVTLNWDDNSGEKEDGFTLQRDHRNVWETLPDIGPNLTVYTDTTTMMNTRYRYRIRSYNAAGVSAWSNDIELTTPNGPPEAPRNLAAETRSTSMIRLSWAPGPSGNQDGFIIERASEASGGVFEQVGNELGENIYSLEDSGLEENTLYSYRAMAFNEIDRSPNSNVASAQTWSIIVLDDGFEDYPTGQDPPDPWEINSRGGSFAHVSDADPHAGQKHLQIVDSNANPVDSAFVQVITYSRPVVKGSMTCWLKLSSGGFFGLIGGDDRNYITFQVQFNDNGSVLVRHGGVTGLIPGFVYPQDEWFKIDIDFDVRTQTYTVTFNDVNSFSYNLQRQDHPGNEVLILSTFSNATINYVNLDDVMILDTVEEPGMLSAPVMLPASGEGNAKIGTASRLVGPVR